MKLENNTMLEAVPSETVHQSMDNPWRISGKNGPIVVGTDSGFNYSDINQDAVAVDPEINAFGVIDGMGFYSKGDIAATCSAEALQDGFASGKSFRAMQIDMHHKMREAGLVEDGVAYIAARIEGDMLIGALAGDVTLIVIGKDGVPHARTTPEHRADDHGVLTNCVTGRSPGKTTNFAIPLQEGDRVLAYSDGIADNFTPEEIAEMIQGKSIEEAFKIIADATEAKMKSGKGKPDNRTLLIYDIETVN